MEFLDKERCLNDILNDKIIVIGEEKIHSHTEVQTQHTQKISVWVGIVFLLQEI